MNAEPKKKLIVIAGPTATGKTSVAIQIAGHLNTSIISADSRQCYKEMTIGTAKPTEKELHAVKHYFINQFHVTENINAADFERLALGYLNEIYKNSYYAIVCGGTGLYIKALCEGLDEMPPVDTVIEMEVNNDYKSKGLEWLKDVTKSEDPQYFNTGETQNPARLLRALIFKRSTGHSITGYRHAAKKERPFHIIKIGLTLPRQQLYKRINARVDRMMFQGLEEEAKALYPMKHLKNLQTVGYTELFDYMDGKYSLNEATEKIKQHTRNYAKRQQTWFMRDEDIQWFNADDMELLTRIKEYLKKSA